MRAITGAMLLAVVGAAVITPPPNSQGVCVDTQLSITFDREPIVGTCGAVSIVKVADGSVVDTIEFSEKAVDTMGPKGSNVVRKVQYSATEIEGNTVIIKLHNGVLDYNTEYRVEVDQNAFLGSEFGGEIFMGTTWSFKTAASAPLLGHNVTVDAAGNGDFCTVQGALNFVMASPATDVQTTVDVAAGTYRELLWINRKNNVHIRGQSRQGTVVKALNSELLNTGAGKHGARHSALVTGGRSVFLVEDCDLLTVESISFVNTATDESAEAVYFKASDEQRFVAVNAEFHSEVNTLRVEGVVWMYRSIVSGHTDFVTGSASSAVFEESEIRSVPFTQGLEDAPLRGVIVKADVDCENERGFVFLNSVLTRAPGVNHLTVYLAQASAGDFEAWDNVAFINTKMDTHIKPIGWAGSSVTGEQPNPANATETAGWREYGTMTLSGAAGDLTERYAEESRELTECLYKILYSERAMTFIEYKNGEGWNPQPFGIVTTDNLALSAGITAGAASANDGSVSTYWTPSSWSSSSVSSISLKFAAPTKINSAQIVEATQYRITQWQLEDGATGVVLASGEIVYETTIEFADVVVQELKFVVLAAWEAPRIAEFEAFAVPARCGGAIPVWHNCLHKPGCCSGHYKCYEANDFFAQCREECNDSDWTCKVLE